MRFDHHPLPVGEAPGCSVWYAARSLTGVASGRRVCFVKLRTALTVLNLHEAAARAFGLDQRIGTAEDYESTQAWDRSFYGNYPEIHGIRWSGRQAGSICIVLNNRVSMDSLRLIEDRDIAHLSVWPRISRAARRSYLPILAP